MIDDMRRRPRTQPAATQQQRPTAQPHGKQSTVPAPAAPQPGELPPVQADASYEPPKHGRMPKKWGFLALLAIFLIGVAVVGWAWYSEALKPVAPNNVTKQKVVITDGVSFSYVVDRLKERGLIRSKLAFTAHAYMSGKHGQLKAGTCALTPDESSQEILNKLTSGCHDFSVVTFYPGQTIYQSKEHPDEPYAVETLKNAGFTDKEITDALAADYDSPLFDGKPASADLEGYIYGETYYVDTGASIDTVLKTTFDQMYKEITDNELLPKFKEQGLSLFEAITLASIVQKELGCQSDDENCYKEQQRVAQIFLTRLKLDMPLGSDVTFYYAADKLGVKPSVTVKSPYNTRINKGLPPGPIASPGIGALKAVANPAPGDDYLYFIAGDDGNLYTAKTQAEHEKNIEKYCKKLCFEL